MFINPWESLPEFVSLVIAIFYPYSGGILWMYRNYNASLSKASSITVVTQCRGGGVSSFSVIGKHGHWRASLASMLTSTHSSRAEPSRTELSENGWEFSPSVLVRLWMSSLGPLGHIRRAARLQQITFSWRKKKTKNKIHPSQITGDRSSSAWRRG